MAEWKPIETAPKDGTDILLALKGEQMVACWLEPRFAPISGWHVSDGHTTHPLAAGTPTHWMPLPEPPSVLPLAKGGEG